MINGDTSYTLRVQHAALLCGASIFACTTDTNKLNGEIVALREEKQKKLDRIANRCPNITKVQIIFGDFIESSETIRSQTKPSCVKTQPAFVFVQIIQLGKYVPLLIYTTKLVILCLKECR